MRVQLHPVQGVTTPLTLQYRGCGGKGDSIYIPYKFLTNWNTTRDTYTHPGKLLAHQFVKLRFGVFDEKGFPSDPMYPSYYKYNNRLYPTGVSNTPIRGTWLTTAGTSPCRPDIEECRYQPLGSNDQVFCSLGYLPNLQSVHSYCKPDHSELNVAPTKHNVICDGTSIIDIIENSDDYKTLTSKLKNEIQKSEKVPQINVVQEKYPKYVLVFETSASMAANDDWKYINKAAQKLIRYDLSDSAEVAIVTFSNTSKVEAPLTVVRESRSYLADIIPDKYRLNKDDDRCVIYGFNTAITEVLKDDKEGAHIILVTRGTKDTLNGSDENTIKEYAEFYQVLFV